jgi:hypothetical protein
LVVTAGSSGAIFIDVDVGLFSSISLAGLVPHNPESHISSVLAKFLDREDGMLLGCRTKPPPSCTLRTVGVEELIRVSPSVMALSDPPL